MNSGRDIMIMGRLGGTLSSGGGGRGATEAEENISSQVADHLIARASRAATPIPKYIYSSQGYLFNGCEQRSQLAW